MPALVPIALFGWLPLSLVLFSMLQPARAVLATLLGGWLFLPNSEIDLPGFPPYTKSTAIALGLMLGAVTTGSKGRAPFALRWFDYPVLVFCVGSAATSLSNDLGLYDGASTALEKLMFWAVPYFFGRLYFTNLAALRDMAIAFAIGGIVYGVLCLYEIRMSPRLNLNVYGFLQHSWRQHIRYGGWRPMVFMEHGLMVALWMAATTTVSFWLWRGRVLTRVAGMPLAWVTPALAVVTVLCKSAGGWLALSIGVGTYYLYQGLRMRWVLVAALLVFPAYVFSRITGLVAADQVQAIAETVFDRERVGSLVVRLSQEDPFVSRALIRPILGWGGYGRGWPVDPFSGSNAVRQVDALWLVVFSKFGLLGLISLCMTLVLGPLIALRSVARARHAGYLQRFLPAVLCVPVALFLADSLFNGMANPAYTLAAGALAGFGSARA